MDRHQCAFDLFLSLSLSAWHTPALKNNTVTDSLELSTNGVALI